MRKHKKTAPKEPISLDNKISHTVQIRYQAYDPKKFCRLFILKPCKSVFIPLVSLETKLASSSANFVKKIKESIKTLKQDIVVEIDDVHKAMDSHRSSKMILNFSL